jgi:His-Xaa-Ser system radical SAM maturase HxsC
MIPLHASGLAVEIADTVVGRIQPHPVSPGSLLVGDGRDLGGDPHAAITLGTKGEAPLAARVKRDPRIDGIGSLDHLEPGDIVAVHPSGRVDTLFRIASPNNSLFVTERCNSKCLMCSQPPRLVDDIDYFFALNSTLIPMLPRSLPTLGMTGGEPTLLGDQLAQLIGAVARELPETQLEILSNGRALSRPDLVRSIAAAATGKTLFTIPLYSDYGPQHDYVVQARNAFSQTVIGLHNLARYRVRSEIRVVLHRQSAERLPALARFIHKNLSFVEHVAFMGLEHTGYARLHDDVLWMDPPAYARELETAIDYLTAFGYPVSLYNLQPCLMPRSLWPFLRTSISDWKREYLPACDGCALHSECGGVFGTSRRQCDLIRAIPHDA